MTAKPAIGRSERRNGPALASTPPVGIAHLHGLAGDAHQRSFPGVGDRAVHLVAEEHIARSLKKARLFWAARALGSTSRLARAQHLQCLLDATLTRLVAFGVFNPAGVLLAVGVRQCPERRACCGVSRNPGISRNSPRTRRTTS